MKHRVSELSGKLLNCAVAKALDLDHKIGPYLDVFTPQGDRCYEIKFSPSTDWKDCGPLIDKFDVQLHTSINRINGRIYVASIGPYNGQAFTQLRAICRAVVMSEIGNEVEL